MIKVEINGKEIEAAEGSMLIDVADDAGINIPRFCYHKKLSVAANCRMCLVEVANSPKCVPACATPVADGMVVNTRSKKALEAQQSVMEFLLINHPLDCPICDQGGECELQDVAMDYGSDISLYSESKRIVGGRAVGPLIQTDLTRCIHCTRCVRFGQEVAGIMELGMTGRGEHMEIATFIESSVDSELSGNVIDLCPVGALTSKPFRYKIRTWELKSHKSVAPHDSAGSNIQVHEKDDTVYRFVPAENEEINEVWMSDRDRFSYESIHSEDRLTQPMIKVDGEWKTTDWETALSVAAEHIKAAGSDLATLVSETSTLEELHLAQKLTRAMGSESIDHRLEQSDFRATISGVPSMPTSLVGLDKKKAYLIVGSNIRKEQPIMNLRIRKAQQHDSKVFMVNPAEIDMNYPCQQMTGSMSSVLNDTMAIAKAALVKAGSAVPEVLASVTPSAEHDAIVSALSTGDSAILLGRIAQASTINSELLYLTDLIAKATGAEFNWVPKAGNTVGAYQVNALPGKNGQNAGEILSKPQKGVLMMGVEPGEDSLLGQKALEQLEASEHVVAMTAFDSQELRDVADVMLPTALFVETAGTFVNAEGRVQTVRAAINPTDEIKPAWKVLRVLGNQLDLDGFGFNSTADVRQDMKLVSSPMSVDYVGLDFAQAAEIPNVNSIYRVDAMVRRSPSLQSTNDAQVVGENNV